MLFKSPTTHQKKKTKKKRKTKNKTPHTQEGSGNLVFIFLLTHSSLFYKHHLIVRTETFSYTWCVDFPKMLKSYSKQAMKYKSKQKHPRPNNVCKAPVFSSVPRVAQRKAKVITPKVFHFLDMLSLVTSKEMHPKTGYLSVC